MTGKHNEKENIAPHVGMINDLSKSLFINTDSIDSTISLLFVDPQTFSAEFVKELKDTANSSYPIFKSIETLDIVNEEIRTLAKNEMIFVLGPDADNVATILQKNVKGSLPYIVGNAKGVQEIIAWITKEKKRHPVTSYFEAKRKRVEEKARQVSDEEYNKIDKKIVRYSVSSWGYQTCPMQYDTIFEYEDGEKIDVCITASQIERQLIKWGFEVPDYIREEANKPRITLPDEEEDF